jgi:phosphate/sulfate permease
MMIILVHAALATALYYAQGRHDTANAFAILYVKQK